MNQRILFLFFIFSYPVIAQHAFKRNADSVYLRERKIAATILNKTSSANHQLSCIDSFFFHNSFQHNRLISELHAKKAEVLYELNAQAIDSTFLLITLRDTIRKPNDTTGNFLLNPILAEWQNAISIYPSPEYRVKRYEQLLMRYQLNPVQEHQELDTLTKMGYRKKFQSILFSAGTRLNDKNVWFFLESSLIRNDVQPHYELKTLHGKFVRLSRYTESILLTLEMKDANNYGVSFSPARITSFFIADPIRIGVKKSWEGNTFRWFLRPSAGISYKFFSILYSYNVYFRRSEARPSDVHYIQLKASIPLFKKFD